MCKNISIFIFTQRDEIEKYESELIAKDNLLEECHRKIEKMDEQLKLLEAENRMLLTQKSHEELDRLQLKKKSLTLTLHNTTSTTDVQTDTLGLPTNGTETCDTFHTANSDCSFASALPSPFPPKSGAVKTPETCEASDLPLDGKTLMSDSGVCLDVKLTEPTTSSANNLHPQAKHCIDGDNLSTNSSQNFYEQLLQTQMMKLREEIAGKKAEIMKVLETGGEKSVLDEMINELQELQKDYVKMEMRVESFRGKFLLLLLKSRFKDGVVISVSDGFVSDGEMSTELRGSDSDESRHHNPLTMSTMSTRNNSITASMFTQHIMTRSLPSIEASQAIRKWTRSGISMINRERFSYPRYRTGTFN